MKHDGNKAECKTEKNQKIFTWSDLIGVAGYKGPRKSIRDLQLRAIKAKK